MELSEAAQFYVGYCFEGNEIRHLPLIFGDKHHHGLGEKKHSFTEQVLSEMVESGRVVIKYRDSKNCNLAGVVGMSPNSEIDDSENVDL